MFSEIQKFPDAVPPAMVWMKGRPAFQKELKIEDYYVYKHYQIQIGVYTLNIGLYF